jgi:hypothetical protein
MQNRLRFLGFLVLATALTFPDRSVEREINGDSNRDAQVCNVVGQMCGPRLFLCLFGSKLQRWLLDSGSNSTIIQKLIFLEITGAEILEMTYNDLQAVCGFSNSDVLSILRFSTKTCLGPGLNAHVPWLRSAPSKSESLFKDCMDSSLPLLPCVLGKTCAETF